MSSRAPRRRKLHWLRRLAVSATSALAALIAIELWMRFVVAKELFSFVPIYARHEIAGYRFQANVAAYAFGADVRTNEHGFRGGPWTREKPAGALRIALIGDSLVFGFGVAESETVGEVLAASLARRLGRRCEVQNFGVPGYNPAQELEVLEREALAFQPDLVLVLLCGNDDQPALYVDREGFLHFEPNEAEDTRVATEHRPRSDRWGILRHSAYLAWVKLQWSRRKAREQQARVSARDAARGSESEPTFARISDDLKKHVFEPLLGMQALCAARRIPLVVLSFHWRSPFRAVFRELEERTSTPVYYFAELFPETSSWEEFSRRYSLGWDSHPNAEAHACWASGIEAFLIGRGLFSKP